MFRSGYLFSREHLSSLPKIVLSVPELVSQSSFPVRYSDLVWDDWHRAQIIRDLREID